MEPINRKQMGSRLGVVAALAAVGLALLRLGRLLSLSPEDASWVPVVIAAMLVGTAASAVALAAGARPWTLVPLTLVGAALAACRVAAAPTLAFGVIPTLDTFPALSAEVGVALELIRYGSAPVLAATGLVAVLAAVFWCLGSAIALGVVKRRPLAATIPSLSFYLLLATFDRRPPVWWWPAFMATCGAVALLAAGERRAGGRARSSTTGRIIPAAGRLLPALTLLLIAMAAGGAARSFAATVPESGVVAWRTPTGFGGGLFGGVSYNLFTSFQQDLASQSQEVMFAARVSENAPPNSDLYWKLITLDAYDGEFWLPANLNLIRPADAADWEASDFVFRGPVVRVESVVQIVGLRQNFLPVLYSPKGLETGDPILAGSYQAREDGSVRFDARTSDGLVYRAISDLPLPDMSVLASTRGELSPIFANAQAAGQFPVAPSQALAQLPSSRVREVYTGLPDDFPDEIRELASLVAEPGSTAFERAMLLEIFFRSTGQFTYDAGASTGHSDLDLTAWLLDPQSRNFRTGYCEQFAAAMALMARSIGIPARLSLGFAPGEVTTQEDGSELIVVRASHAHAWVELFMAGQGWIRFDPTPRGDRVNPATVSELGFDPGLFLPEPIDPTQSANGPQLPEGLLDQFLEPGADPTLGLPGRSGFAAPGWTRPLLIALGMAALIPVFKALRRGNRLARLRDGEIEAGWSELIDRLHDLGQPLGWWLTPIEVARSVDPAILPLAARLGASIYGGHRVGDGLTAYRQAETALRQRYSGWKWLGSWFQPRSLWRNSWSPPISELQTVVLR
jgi:transglutaminase-like putative cysteine protease